MFAVRARTQMAVFYSLKLKHTLYYSAYFTILEVEITIRFEDNGSYKIQVELNN